jgi:preprotein translocase subunit SecD
MPLNKDAGFGFGRGLDYGLDFAGGTQLYLKLESGVTSDVMTIEKTILENRLNSMGLKDIAVRPWGNQYILVQIAESTPEELEHIENILKQQARFEERIDGEVAIKGDEIKVDLGPRGIELYNLQGGYHWAVAVSHSKDGACRFGTVGDGKRGRPVDIFIDRPENTSIVFYSGDYMLLGNLTGSSESDRFFFGNTPLEVISNRSRIPVVELSSTTQAVEQLVGLKAQGYFKVKLAGDERRIPDDLRNQLEEMGFKTERDAMGNRSYTDWVSSLVGLQSSPRLDFDTRGECVYEARITGSVPTLEEARMEIQRNQVLLTSGNLPVELTVESKSTTPPALGRKFLSYSLYTGLVAIAAVALVIYIRYRRPEIVLPVMITGTGEILIILGVAALINWELDLAGIAGIIASVGTGVNDQIVITDETLKRTKQKKIINLTERIRRAFFIIFTAAATIIAAMIPLLGIGAGMLKGFAFTTIIGVLIGVIITRPGYAKVIEEILRKEE